MELCTYLSHMWPLIATEVRSLSEAVTLSTLPSLRRGRNLTLVAHASGSCLAADPA